MAGISNCRYCDQPIVWITRTNGSWQRPFDAPAELIGLDYEVSWDPKMGDWSASPVDTEVVAKLVQHDCPKRAEMVAERRAKLEAEQELRPAMERLFGPPPDDEPVERVFGTPTRRELPVRTVYRNPSPEQYERVAERIRHRCPTCGAMAFRWCVFADNAPNQAAGRVGQHTTNLHTARS
jgi:hypothetical protein